MNRVLPKAHRSTTVAFEIATHFGFFFYWQAAPSSSCSSSTVLHLSQQLSRANADADRLRDELALHERATSEQLARKDADIAELRRQVAEAEKREQASAAGSKQVRKENGTRDEVAHLRLVRGLYASLDGDEFNESANDTRL